MLAEPDWIPEPPQSIATETVSLYSTVAYHWGRQENLKFFFQNPPFPKSLSVWLEATKSQVFFWIFSRADIAPDYLFKITVAKGAQAVAFGSEMSGNYLFVAYPDRILRYNVTNPETVGNHDLETSELVAKATSLDFLSTPTGAVEEYNFLLAVDEATNKIFVFDLTLSLVTRISFGERLIMARPRGMSCRTESHPVFLTQSKHVAACYIADSKDNRMIHFEVDSTNPNLNILVGVYEDYRLSNPQHVAYYQAAGGVDLVYVATVSNIQLPMKSAG